MTDDKTKYFISEDIKSTFSPKVIYGKRGDRVTGISINQHVVIVEDKKGQRFPANIEKLTRIN